MALWKRPVARGEIKSDKTVAKDTAKKLAVQLKEDWKEVVGVIKA